MSIIWDLHISLLIGDCIERESERERGYVHLWNVKTVKWYYVHNMRSAYFPINRRLCRERDRVREAMSICEMVKTQKWYYLHNARSAYFPMDRGLHREREGEQERERLCPSVKHENGTISIIWDLHISLLIGDCRERERAREREAMSICETWKWYYLHHMRSAYFPFNRGLHRERERESKRERESLCPSVKWWKHRNSTVSIIHDLHISLSIGDCIERERERERERAREREREREREAMSIHEMVKT